MMHESDRCTYEDALKHEVLNKISCSQFYEWTWKYYLPDDKKNHLRIGQSFIIRKFPEIIDPEVFYASLNETDMFNLILKKYVDLEQN